jgi:hypothetical protein
VQKEKNNMARTMCATDFWAARTARIATLTRFKYLSFTALLHLRAAGAAAFNVNLMLI